MFHHVEACIPVKWKLSTVKQAGTGKCFCCRTYYSLPLGILNVAECYQICYEIFIVSNFFLFLLSTMKTCFWMIVLYSSRFLLFLRAGSHNMSIRQIYGTATGVNGGPRCSTQRRIKVVKTFIVNSTGSLMAIIIWRLANLLGVWGELAEESRSSEQGVNAGGKCEQAHTHSSKQGGWTRRWPNNPTGTLMQAALMS